MARTYDPDQTSWAVGQAAFDDRAESVLGVMLVLESLADRTAADRHPLDQIRALHESLEQVGEAMSASDEYPRGQRIGWREPRDPREVEEFAQFRERLDRRLLLDVN